MRPGSTWLVPFAVRVFAVRVLVPAGTAVRRGPAPHRPDVHWLRPGAGMPTTHC
ncbi:hypothetical protein ThrDRAFT_01665 [Frankia casuarinae]|nr:hypothetical protein CcI6DRAFT_01282 [Frankia sp. CcI6]EYT92710.1 hypothetical protein ThrDRAFT_01665 [Frankia casuarinae]KDA43645.1 hypothetical protein BMG523Draft_01550 [Frankia sp. BMG5.23]KFB05110.1 hypothetical protein ALLO2DRAFT_02169 [Frankia sp. Allo2]OAA25499.1 hypothetical protein AAY23_10384 [Frankia casuarinae]